ncbi:uncharacterized protein TM35_000271500 [Trypanosoma theileri]|uniref:Transmembrane protein n=1 Tax=Trypanosoma theileri TaxID=67003 RepID=A0A1X0NR27_9TRYP|nr:uncharacterized protein TM35_000271500 [Trypanosoma theileri]ORC86560.1 hypothetical protein TM35_000271500 [Trypanosoma theileri]
MSILSSLTAPLLLRRRRRVDAATLDEKNENEKKREPVVRCSSPTEFMRKVQAAGVPTPPKKNTNNTNRNNKKKSKNNDKSSECEDGESPIITQIKSNPHRILRFTEKWTFASSPFPDDNDNNNDDNKGWSAMTTNRLDHVLQTWSRLTTHLVSPHLHGSAAVSFFPTKLPKCIASSASKCSDSIFYEVRAHIPIRLLHQPLPDPDTADISGVVPDTLAEFVSSNRMYARRLRALMHDAVLSFMSSASHAAPPTKLWRCNGTMLRETSCVSIGGTSPIEEEEEEEEEEDMEERNGREDDDDEEVEETISNVCCHCSKLNIKAMHQLLSPSLYALAPPNPIVLTVRVVDHSSCGCSDDIAPLLGVGTKNTTNTTTNTANTIKTTKTTKKKEAGENIEMEAQDVTLLVHVVARVSRVHGDESQSPSPSPSQHQQWDAAAVAFEVLTGLFPERFILHGANAVAVGEVLPDGRLAALSSFTTAELTAARCRMRDARVWLPPQTPPLPISLSPSPSLLPSPASLPPSFASHTGTTAPIATGTITPSRGGNTTATTTTTTGMRVQHDPYSFVAWTPTDDDPEQQTLDEQEEQGEEQGEEQLPGSTEEATSLTDDRASSHEEADMFTRHAENKKKGDVDVSHDTAQGTSTQATTTPTVRDDTEEVEEALNQVRKEHEEEEEEEEELDIQNTKKKILSICEEIATARIQWIEEQQKLEDQLSALLLQSMGMEESSLITATSTSTTTALRRKKNKSGKHNTNITTGSDTEAVERICGLLGISSILEYGSGNGNNNNGSGANNNNSNSSGDVLLQQALITHVIKNSSRNNTYNDMDECVKDASEIIQKLESRLRAKALRVQYIQNMSRRPLNGGVAAKSSRKKKNDIPLFAAVAKGILQDRQRHTGALSRKKEDDIGNSNHHNIIINNTNNNNTINSHLNNSGESIVLQCTKSGCMEAHRSIDAACEKLRAAAVWSQECAEQLQCVRLICEEVLLPYLQNRISLEKTEEKERAQLQVEYTVSSAILWEAQSTRRSKVEEKEVMMGIAKKKRTAGRPTNRNITTTNTTTINKKNKNNKNNDISSINSSISSRSSSISNNDNDNEEEEEEYEENGTSDTLRERSGDTVESRTQPNRPHRTETNNTNNNTTNTANTNNNTNTTVSVQKRKGKTGGSMGTPQSTALADSPIETTTKGRVSGGGGVLGGGKKKTGVNVEPRRALLRERDALQRKTFLLFVVFCLIAALLFFFL